MKSILSLIPLSLLIVGVYYLIQISIRGFAFIVISVLILSIIKIIKTSAIKVEAIKDRTCYKCGSKMVLKTSQKGKYEGKKFYGCSNYPNCDCMIDINGRPISMFYRKYREVSKGFSKANRAPVCSKCGATMVMRTAKQGVYKGNKFYGCSRYPRCKNIVNSYQASRKV